MDRLHNNFQDILDAIDESMQKGRLVPALILIYTGIDNISNLAETENKPTGTIFKEWVKKWMLTKHKLPCNEIDIWSARCGLLHQQISESKLTNDGKAKQIYYSHGGADVKGLELLIGLSGKQAVAIVVEDLIFSFKMGMIDCITEIGKNPEWKASFDLKESKLFMTFQVKTP